MLIVGVDPGMDGAAACVWKKGGRLRVESVHNEAVKSKGRGRIILLPTMWEGMSRLLLGADHAFIENVNVRPEEGASSGFKFGETMGYCKAFTVAASVPYTMVTPNMWMRSVGIPGKNDDASLEAAMRLFPDDADQFRSRRLIRNKKQCVGCADATLIAYYGYMKLGGMGE